MCHLFASSQGKGCGCTIDIDLRYFLFISNKGFNIKRLFNLNLKHYPLTYFIYFINFFYFKKK